MRTREDILSELAELKAHPPKNYSGSMVKAAKKSRLMSELNQIETEELDGIESSHHKFQFDNLEINISITKK
ncbi:hypothetical protein [Mammaliicoccus vitulinus]|uniref:hypothetical protein n=1 Tax=Mammaliicoccus vitulinus TaxID=71237 RepID=UPI003BA2B876